MTPLPDGPRAPAQRLEGASFSFGTKCIATLLVGGLVLYGLRAAEHPAASSMSVQARMFVLVAIAIVAISYVAMLRSRTSIDDTHIRQGSFFPKQVALADIAQLKLIRARGFEWLVAPRLIVRAGSLGTSTFHCADPQVLAAFELLAYGGTQRPPRA